MSGIAAVLGSADSGVLVEMLASIRHRGPDDTHVVHANGHALGCVGRKRTQSTKRPSAPSLTGLSCVADGVLLDSAASGCAASDLVAPDQGILDLYQERGAHLGDFLSGTYAFVLVDGNRLLAGRDPLGAKPLYWGWLGGAQVFASEMKALLTVGASPTVFPPGRVYDSQSGMIPRPVHMPDKVAPGGSDAEAEELRAEMYRAVRELLPEEGPTGVLLSGGIDSSAVAAMAAPQAQQLIAFTAGTEGSDDLGYARSVADLFGLEHHEYVFDAGEARRVLPEVIYHLESFDYPLVRSAISNFMASRVASDHVAVVLCGEGADELFAGYDELKAITDDGELADHLKAMLDACHSTGFQRVDRMNAAHGLSARMPYIAPRIMRLANRISADHKVYGSDRLTKWILRKAFETDLPADIVWRPKRKFWVGSGTSSLMEDAAQKEVSDADFVSHRVLPNGHELRNKEEMLYYGIFRDFFGDDVSVLNTVGITPVL